MSASALWLLSWRHWNRTPARTFRWRVAVVALANSVAITQAEAQARPPDPDLAASLSAQASSDSSPVRDATSAIEQGRFGDAPQILATLEASMTARRDAAPESIGIVLSATAAILDRLQRHQEALGYRQRYLAISSASLGLNHPDTLAAMGNTAKTMERLGHWQEAADMLRWALDLRHPSLEQHDPVAMLLAARLAVILDRMGEVEFVVPLRRALLESFMHHFGDGTVCVGTALHDYATALRKAGLLAHALHAEHQALRIFGAHENESRPYLVEAWWGLGRVHLVRGETAAADSAFRRASR